jgi:RHS repeat-associated protein
MGLGRWACKCRLRRILARYEYTYDERNNRKTELYSDERATGELTSYGYDAADRLVGVQYPSGETVLYGLAGDGSRVCEKRLAAYGGPMDAGACEQASSAIDDLAYTFDGRGGLRGAENRVTGKTTAYVTDPAGRLASENGPQGVKQYTWDAAGRLSEVSVAALVAGVPQTPSVSSYRYDFAGHRIGKEATSGNVAYLWGGDELVEERTGRGAIQYQHVGGTAFAAGGERLMHDGLGSAVGRVSEASTVVYRYDAWGNLRPGYGVPGPDDASVAYTGHAYDPDAQLTYARARWYDSRVGRFISADPAGGDLAAPASLHAFNYANGNPLKYVDPDGASGNLAQKIAPPEPQPTVRPPINPANEPMRGPPPGIWTQVRQAAAATGAFLAENGLKVGGFFVGIFLPGNPNDVLRAWGLPIRGGWACENTPGGQPGSCVPVPVRKQDEKNADPALSPAPPAGQPEPGQPGGPDRWIKKEERRAEEGQPRASNEAKPPADAPRAKNEGGGEEASEEESEGPAADKAADPHKRELAPGERRSPAENKKARRYYKANKDKAIERWEDREQKEWPINTETGEYQWAEHPRPLSEGGDPLFIVPGEGDDPNAVHMVPGPDGLTDQQRWGKMGPPARAQKAKERERYQDEELLNLDDVPDDVVDDDVVE